LGAIFLEQRFVAAFFGFLGGWLFLFEKRLYISILLTDNIGKGLNAQQIYRRSIGNNHSLSFSCRLHSVHWNIK
jgi:hypothetical protein